LTQLRSWLIFYGPRCSVDVLVRCKDDGTDDGTAPAVIRARPDY